jgi:hypothetical protein
MIPILTTLALPLLTWAFARGIPLLTLGSTSAMACFT